MSAPQSTLLNLQSVPCGIFLLDQNLVLLDANTTLCELLGLARDDAILLIDQSGPTTALVKVHCQIPPRYFTDYLNLLKVGGQWKVAQKVFATRATP